LHLRNRTGTGEREAIVPPVYTGFNLDAREITLFGIASLFSAAFLWLRYGR
jgi:hypothetical protein